jgi:hypothetical protein
MQKEDFLRCSSWGALIPMFGVFDYGDYNGVVSFRFDAILRVLDSLLNFIYILRNTVF